MTAFGSLVPFEDIVLFTSLRIFGYLYFYLLMFHAHDQYHVCCLPRHETVFVKVLDE
jgi:hypothetical protein